MVNGYWLLVIGDWCMIITFLGGGHSFRKRKDVPGYWLLVTEAVSIRRLRKPDNNEATTSIFSSTSAKS